MNPDNTPLDPQVVNLAKAIRQTESGGNFQAQGKSGEYGGYQFTRDTWNSASQKFLGKSVSLDKATPEQQNEVAYKQIKEWKDRGNNVGQIASMWNAGERHANAYQDGYAGTNSFGVKYDTGAYANKVADAYQTLKSGSGQSSQNNTSATTTPQDGNFVNPSSTPQTGNFVTPPAVSASQPVPQNTEPQAPQEPGLGEQLGGRVNDAGQAISNTLSGKINPISGVLQTVGAVAGGVNDVVSSGLELVPGFKQLEGLLGKGVGALAQTQVGQSVGRAIQDFSTAHPELAADIGAGFNIATALPIFEGLGALKNVALDSASVALKNVAEKGAIKDLTEVASRTVGGRKLLSKVPDALKTMVDERALPSIEAGRYATAGAEEKLSAAISKINEKELQPILEEVSKNQNFGQSLSTLKKIAIKTAEEDPTLKEAGVVPQALKQIESRFNGWKYSYGDSVDLATENRLKIGTGKFSDWRSPEGSADKAIYHAFQNNIEEVAKKSGLGDVSAINKRMQKIIKAQDLLQYIDKKAVKNKGLIHDLIRGAATAGGELAGNAAGVPIAGAIVGNRTTGLIERSLGNLSPSAIRGGVLERTAQGATRQTARGVAKKTGGLIGAALASRANRP